MKEKFCMDCGKLLSDCRSIRCRSCSKKGKLHPLYGKPQSEETKNKRSKSLKGSHHGFKFEKGNKFAWKGGCKWYFHRNARKVISENIGRELLPNEMVHHIDNDEQNNAYENLMVLSRTEHMKLHGLQRNGINPKP